MPKHFFGHQRLWSRRGFNRTRIPLVVISLFLLAQVSAGAGLRWDIHTVHTPSGVPFQEVRDILEDEEGGIWIATWGGGVTRIHGTDWKTYDELNGLPSNGVRSVDTDRAGSVWIGTIQGLCRIRGGTINVFTTDNVSMFPNNSIRDIKCPRDGSIWIAFSIEDTGTGISKEDQVRVFEPFFTTKSRGQGTGLGLAIVHGIVTDHSGHVEVESSGKNQGTRITVQLPLCDEGSWKDQELQNDEPIHGKDEIILIAEDHPEIQELMSRYFEDVGYQVLSAADGVEVLSLFTEHQRTIQLMILDIDLPKRSGIDCLTTIQKSHGQIPTILISGLAEAPVLAEQWDHILFIKKPFSMSTLSRLIRQLLPLAPRDQLNLTN